MRSMYNALITNDNIYQHKLLWKLQVPLKIKNFLWYLSKGVTLTKDNLARRNWNGNKKCVFCTDDESIQHLFIECHYAQFLWRIIHFTFGVQGPSSINEMFNNWLLSFRPKDKKQMLVGSSALCWAIWTSRNDMVFDKSPFKTYLQVLFRATYWCRQWALLQKSNEDKEKIKGAIRALESVAMHIFANHGCRFSNRISF